VDQAPGRCCVAGAAFFYNLSIAAIWLCSSDSGDLEVLPIHRGSQFLHADTQASRNSPDRGPSWRDLVTLNSSIRPKSQIRPLTYPFLSHLSCFSKSTKCWSEIRIWGQRASHGSDEPY
jgi:hypothetical protein